MLSLTLGKVPLQPYLQQHKLSPSVVKEREWATPATNHWNTFFDGTSKLLSQRGREQCDCKTSGSSNAEKNGTTTNNGGGVGTTNGGGSGGSGRGGSGEATI